MNRKIGFLIALSAFIVACSLPGWRSSSSSPDDATPSSSSSSPDEPAPPSSNQPLIPLLTAPTSMPSDPIGLRQGLASLNSYRLEIRTINNGPMPQDKNETTFLMESASDGESWHISNYSLSSSTDEPEVSTSQSDQYKVGNVMCETSDDEDEAEITDVDPQAQEILDVGADLLDLVPKVSDPVFVGSELLNGVQTNHFQFKVSGLGVDSGAEVAASDGEYWLAVDGQYIVRYFVHLETRNGPAGDANTHVLRSELNIEVKDINQPITISLPAKCQ